MAAPPLITDPRIAVRSVDTREAREGDIPGIGALRGGVLTTWHVTDDPHKVLDMIRPRVDLVAAFGPKGARAELGPGLYTSGVPHYWVSRAKNKWSFLERLQGDPLKKLCRALQDRLNQLGAERYVTEGEWETATRMIRLVREGTYHPEGLLEVAGQPYNVEFWKPGFLGPLGIPPGPPPRVVEIRLAGRLMELAGSGPPAAFLRQVRRLGYVGAYTKSGMATNPELVVWDSRAIVSAREVDLED